MSKPLRLLMAITLCEGAGILGSIFTFSQIPTWYQTLNKPFFSPPNFVFGPVWTLLYFLMGISLYLVWGKKAKEGDQKNKGLKYFYLQLGLNALWSIVFFGAHQLLLSFIVILALWWFILQTIKTFDKVSQTASYLLYPYLAWVSFASILNLSIVILNR